MDDVGLVASLVIIGLGILLGFVFWVSMLVSAITRTPRENNLHIAWILVILFTNLLGAVLYFLIQIPRNPIPQNTFPPRRNA